MDRIILDENRIVISEGVGKFSAFLFLHRLAPTEATRTAVCTSLYALFRYTGVYFGQHEDWVATILQTERFGAKDLFEELEKATPEIVTWLENGDCRIEVKL